jgi:hypothetical protein
VTYTEIVFVHSPEEAFSFNEYILVFWPQEEFRDLGFGRARGTQRKMDDFIYLIRRDYPDVDFRDYGLPTDDITKADVIDSWEIVDELFRNYGGFRRMNW